MFRDSLEYKLPRESVIIFCIAVDLCLLFFLCKWWVIHASVCSDFVKMA